jgi:hypothetical protein
MFKIYDLFKLELSTKEIFLCEHKPDNNRESYTEMIIMYHTLTQRCSQITNASERTYSSINILTCL